MRMWEEKGNFWGKKWKIRVGFCLVGGKWRKNWKFGAKVAN